MLLFPFKSLLELIINPGASFSPHSRQKLLRKFSQLIKYKSSYCFQKVGLTHSDLLHPTPRINSLVQASWSWPCVSEYLSVQRAECPDGNRWENVLVTATVADCSRVVGFFSIFWSPPTSGLGKLGFVCFAGLGSESRSLSMLGKESRVYPGPCFCFIFVSLCGPGRYGPWWGQAWRAEVNIRILYCSLP